MDLRLKSFNIMGVHKKIQFLVAGGGFMKNQYIGGKLPKKGGGTQFSDLRGGWGGGGGGGGGLTKKRVGDVPMHIMKDLWTFNCSFMHFSISMKWIFIISITKF